MLADVTACAKAVIDVGANIEIDASVKADIAAKVAAIITVSSDSSRDLTLSTDHIASAHRQGLPQRLRQVRARCGTCDFSKD
jgi:hypothetical protein